MHTVYIYICTLLYSVYNMSNMWLTVNMHVLGILRMMECLEPSKTRSTFGNTDPDADLNVNYLRFPLLIVFPYTYFDVLTKAGFPLENFSKNI